MVVEKLVLNGGKSFVSSLNRNICVGIKDFVPAKLDNVLSAIKLENIQSAVIKRLPSGNTVIEIPNVRGLSSVDPSKTVHIKFNSNGDCLQMTAISKNAEFVSATTYRTDAGISNLKSFGIKEPNPVQTIYIDKINGKRFVTESSSSRPQIGALFEVANGETRILDNKKLLPVIEKTPEQRIAEIRQRLTYSPEIADYTPTILTREEKAELAKELNKILETDKYSIDSTMEELAFAWKRKYISTPLARLSNPKFEKAMLDTFPRADMSQIHKYGDFEYEPLYRWMHIENLPDFLKKFKVDDTYVIDRLQSCSKEKHFGEMWGGFTPQFGFSNWNKDYNIKFVIHPKSAKPMAADMGEGKYGWFEAIYPAGTKFKIVGKIKNKVTQEEINKYVMDGIKFEDFERWEIHLQEI